MAQPTTIDFGAFLILLGNGDGPPETFTAPCGFTDKSFKQTKATSTAIVPDCDDPEATPWSIEGTTSKSIEISGTGTLAMEALTRWQEFFDADDSDATNVKVIFNLPGASGGRTWTGPAILTDFAPTAKFSADAKLVTYSVTMKNAGAWTSTLNP